MGRVPSKGVLGLEIFWSERHKRKISLETVALAFKRSQQWLHKIEHGQAKPPADFEVKYARGLGLPDDFFTIPKEIPELPLMTTWETYAKLKLESAKSKNERTNELYPFLMPAIEVKEGLLVTAAMTLYNAARRNRKGEGGVVLPPPKVVLTFDIENNPIVQDPRLSAVIQALLHANCKVTTRWREKERDSTYVGQMAACIFASLNENHPVKVTVSDLKEAASTSLDIVYVEGEGSLIIMKNFDGSLKGLLVDRKRSTRALEKITYNDQKENDENSLENQTNKMKDRMVDIFGELIKTLGEMGSKSIASEQSIRDYSIDQDKWETHLLKVIKGENRQIYLTPIPSTIFHPNYHFKPASIWYRDKLDELKLIYGLKAEECLNSIIKSRELRLVDFIKRSNRIQRHIVIFETVENWVKSKRRSNRKNIEDGILIKERLEQLITFIKERDKYGFEFAIASKSEIEKVLPLAVTDEFVWTFPEIGVVGDTLLIEFQRTNSGKRDKKNEGLSRNTASLTHPPLADFMRTEVLEKLWDSIPEDRKNTNCLETIRDWQSKALKKDSFTREIPL